MPSKKLSPAMLMLQNMAKKQPQRADSGSTASTVPVKRKAKPFNPPKSGLSKAAIKRMAVSVGASRLSAYVYDTVSDLYAAGVKAVVAKSVLMMNNSRKKTLMLSHVVQASKLLGNPLAGDPSLEDIHIPVCTCCERARYAVDRY